MTTLFCEKYKQQVDMENVRCAPCAHSEGYCRFRTQCVINTLCREKSRHEKVKEDHE